MNYASVAMEGTQKTGFDAGNGSVAQRKLFHFPGLDVHPSVHALQSLLQNPIRFVPATKRTFDDESRMAPNLPPQWVVSETPGKEIRQSKPAHVSYGK